MKTISPPKTNAVSGVEPNATPTKQKGPSSRSAAGFLLMDTSLNPISVNAEAIQILSYPDDFANPRRPGDFLAGRIRSIFVGLFSWVLTPNSLRCQASRSCLKEVLPKSFLYRKSLSNST